MCATGIYYPQQLPREATATHIPSQLGPRQYTELIERKLYQHSARAEHVIHLPAGIIMITITKHVVKNMAAVQKIKVSLELMCPSSEGAEI